MNLIRRRQEKEVFNPFDLMRDLQGDMTRVFRTSLLNQDGWQGFMPDIDVREEGDRIVVEAEAPGMKKEDFDISVQGNTLILRGEKKQEQEKKEKNHYTYERVYGAFSRTIELPTDVKADQVKATYKDGVLEISLPKDQAAKAKKISVEAQ